MQQDRFDDAHLYFTEALRIRRHVYIYAQSAKDNHPVHLEVACVFHELGCCCFAQKSYPQSKQMFTSEKEILVKLVEASSNNRIIQARITNLTWLRKVSNVGLILLFCTTTVFVTIILCSSVPKGWVMRKKPSHYHKRGHCWRSSVNIVQHRNIHANRQSL